MPTAPRMQVASLHSVGWDLRYLIGRVTGRPVHTATIYDGVLYEAAFSGMRKLPAKDRLAKGTWEVTDVPAEFDSARGLQIAKRDLGCKYDWIGVLVAWWLGRVAGAGSRTRNFCSETASEQLHGAGVPLLYRRDAHYTPRRLRDELVKERKWRTRWVVDGVEQPTDAATR